MIVHDIIMWWASRQARLQLVSQAAGFRRMLAFVVFDAGIPA
jgi:hypothetical protein